MGLMMSGTSANKVFPLRPNQATRWDMLSVTKFAMSKASMGGANFAPDLSARVSREH